MLAIALALTSSLCWGLADFAGGLLSRRVAVVAVLTVSQLVGLAGIALLVLALGEPAPGGAAIAWAAGGGICGVLALGCFYRALAIGTMSIVAPISALGAAVPVLAGFLDGERPAGPQLAGMAVALAGVVVASREEVHELAEGPPASRAPVLLACLAALGFGIFLTAIDRAADDGVPWALLVARAASFPLLLAAFLAVRPALPRTGAAVLGLIAIGLLDVLANGLYARATTEGLLAVVAILGSLYPVATVLLAFAVLHERLSRTQAAGVAATFVGVALIAAG